MSGDATRPPAREGRRETAAALALMLLVALVFGRAMKFPYQSDDFWFVASNDRIDETLTVSDLVYTVTTSEMGYFKPVTILSWMSDAALFGKSPSVFRATNVLLHGAGAVALYGATRILTGWRGLAFLTAALWAVHPLRVESVVWIAERKDVLSGLSGFLAIAAYALYARRGRAPSFGLALGFYALSLMAKPTLVTLPVLLLVLDYWPLGRLRAVRTVHAKLGIDPWKLARLCAEKLPFAVLAVLVAGVVLMSAQKGDANAETLELSDRFANLSVSLANAPVAYVRYVMKHLWVASLVPYYPMRSWPLAVVLGSSVLLIGATLAIARGARRFPELWAGWLWFGIALVPMLGIVRFGDIAMADRFSYIPSVGLLWGVLGAAARGVRVPWPGRGLAWAAVAACALAGFVQVGWWKTPERLWSRTLAVTGPSVTAYSALAYSAFRDEDYRRARSLYRNALVLREDANTWASLGHTAQKLGEPRRAVLRYRKAVALAPGSAQHKYNLALALNRVGEVEEATSMLDKAVAQAPDQARYWNELGRLRGKRERWEAAVEALRRAIRLDPDMALAHNNLGVTLNRMGRAKAAARAFRRALRAEPDHERARRNLERLEREMDLEQGPAP